MAPVVVHQKFLILINISTNMNAFNQVDSVFEYCLVLSQLIPQEHSRSIFQGKMIIPLVWRLTALDNSTTRLDLQYMAY